MRGVFQQPARASPATGFASITSDPASGDVINPSGPVKSVTQGRLLSSRAAATKKGSDVWNLRCSSGRNGRTTRRAHASISRTPIRSWTCCSPEWNGESLSVHPSVIGLPPAVTFALLQTLGNFSTWYIEDFLISGIDGWKWPIFNHKEKLICTIGRSAITIAVQHFAVPLERCRRARQRLLPILRWQAQHELY